MALLTLLASACFKVDVKGAERDMLNVLTHRCNVAVRHLNFVLYDPDCYWHRKFIQAMLRCGYLAVARDHHRHGPNVFVEYALVSPEHALTEFMYSQACDPSFRAHGLRTIHFLQEDLQDLLPPEPLCLVPASSICSARYAFLPTDAEMRRMKLPLGCPIKAIALPDGGLGNRLGQYLMLAVFGESLQRPIIGCWRDSSDHEGTVSQSSWTQVRDPL